jgi:hypothetical protein
MKRIDKEEFCNRSNLLHKNKYDYSLTEYKNNRTKVKIICKDHGIFEQIPESHMRGFGCSKCSGNYNYTNDEFISKLKLIFGNKYNYDKVDYKSQSKKVIIECKEHGEFYKFSQVLLRGSGCSKCETKNYKIDTNMFIERAIKIHGNLYDYSLVEYTNDRLNVKIKCIKHGIFEQVASTHLSGHGCIKCSGRYKYTTEEFIEKAIIKHGKIYDYSLVNYTNAHKKVKIICKKHGEFSQKPTAHLLGKGCSSCKESKGEILINNFLIENDIDFIRQKTFKGCKSKSLLFFDFYLPDLNTCIEYDGEFHYLPIFGEKLLSDTKNRDIIKNEYCKSNNIRIIRISYVDFNNIDKILENILNFNKIV